MLGYTDTRDALHKHVDAEDKNTVAFHDGTSGNPNQTIINESGLYSKNCNWAGQTSIKSKPSRFASSRTALRISPFIDSPVEAAHALSWSLCPLGTRRVMRS